MRGAEKHARAQPLIQVRTSFPQGPGPSAGDAAIDLAIRSLQQIAMRALCLSVSAGLEPSSGRRAVKSRSWYEQAVTSIEASP